ncbi:HipA N-terminal domain-containing protein [Adlercreutzia sp. R21]|uniref:HipA N-terminal domain-containing protein n=1 Tax=Adlercreutzia wanghongyangiae TaxID=3111451 RepID=UPI002DBEB265|nr:HipA N-terminal domain-containing protein [Adlercreutzia sp. R21]MEC4184723.1 HipA N-terminal domain-containing protein [Adlercreutzia sp. R21]
MADNGILVYREYFGLFEEVGHVMSSHDGAGFSYSEGYLNSRTSQAISRALPLQPGVFSARATESFFNGILPEGSMRRSLGRAFHADNDDTIAFMTRLNDESAGAFSVKEKHLF